MLQTALSYIWAASGIILIISVLLHSPKGDGMGGLASSGSSMFTSARSAEATLNRVTWTLLTIFLGLAVILSGGCVVRGRTQAARATPTCGMSMPIVKTWNISGLSPPPPRAARTWVRSCMRAAGTSAPP